MPLKYALFDLDNTLYPRHIPIMPAIGERIKTYLMQQLDLNYEEATQKRAYYNHLYGTVIRGLLQEEAVDIQDYLAFVHDVPVHEFLKPNPELSHLLSEIPIHKYIFTNSYRKHAEDVMDALGVREHFEGIFDIQSVNYVSKPAKHPYITVVHALNTTPDTCIYVDDAVRNLEEPKRMGMKTILVDAQPNKWVDVAVEDVLEACRVIKKMIANEHTEDAGD
ncbi:MAG: pyrimidine 5'-nucleotidase [Caldilineae bacterium]|nr:MAG: pyrimidine 5'-nucleotidase [Caldilineae bacterium]